MKKMGSLILSIIFALCLLSGCAVKIAETPILIDETPAVEAPSVPSKVFVLESFTLKRLKWLDTKKQYTVGKNSKLNDAGQIISCEDEYRSTSFIYDEIGAIIAINSTKKADGEVGYMSISYKNGVPTSYYYDLNDNFTSTKNVSIEPKYNDAGQITELIQHVERTDVESHKTSYETEKYEFEYDENAHISSAKYYSEGVRDHIILISYDENSNMTSWKFVENIGVDPYLSLDFSYKLVDGAPVTPTAANSIIPFYNWERMMSFIL